MTCRRFTQPYITLGVDPLIIMATATPITLDLSEWLFTCFYGGSGVHLANRKTTVKGGIASASVDKINWNGTRMNHGT